jgi:ribonuclease R
MVFHSSILDLAKLNADGPQRVITVHSILSKDDFTVKTSVIDFGWIQTTSTQRLTYQEASARILTEPVLSIGIQIAKAFRLKRTYNSTESKALSELSTAYPLISPEGIVSLVMDTPEVRLVKSMIAEFAIHSNQVFAEEIEKGGSAEDTVFRRAILTRVTDKKEEDHTRKGSGLLFPEEVITHIIRSGKSATYTTDKIPHELVNTEAYTHATSPLRRAPDCVVHFLIKSSKLSLPRPFTNLQLKNWSDDLTRKQKTSKNLGFTDSKCRYLQYMSQILESTSPVVNIHYKVISYSNGFVNIHINSLNEYPIHMTYTIRRSYKTFPEHLQENNVRITRVNVPSKFDEGTLPELDRIFPMK